MESLSVRTKRFFEGKRCNYAAPLIPHVALRFMYSWILILICWGINLVLMNMRDIEGPAWWIDSDWQYVVVMDYPIGPTASLSWNQSSAAASSSFPLCTVHLLLQVPKKLENYIRIAALYLANLPKGLVRCVAMTLIPFHDRYPCRDDSSVSGSIGGIWVYPQCSDYRYMMHDTWCKALTKILVAQVPCNDSEFHAWAGLDERS
jgi:hypothetical protein